MIEALFLVGASTGGVIAVGLGMMWVKTRRRTNTGNTTVAVEKFEDAARRVSASQATWYDLQNEAAIVGGGLLGLEAQRLKHAESEAEAASRALYEAWSPVSDLGGDDVASFNDMSRAAVTEHKLEALRVLDDFEAKLAKLEHTMDEIRRERK